MISYREPSDLDKLNLFDSMQLNSIETIIRVPGGWIFRASYNDNLSICFIPFNNDYQDYLRKKNENW